VRFALTRDARPLLGAVAAVDGDMVALNRALGYTDPVRVWTLRRRYDGASTPTRKDTV
jgi:hypothetical protein